MSIQTWALAALTALAVLGALAPRPRRIVAPGERGPDESTAAGSRSPLLVRSTVAAGCGVAVWAFVGPPAGVVVGSVVGVLVARTLARAEPAAVTRRRERLERELPGAVDLLAGCLAAGAAPGSALTTVGRAVGGPVREDLDAVAHRLALGVDPVAVWGALADHAALGPLGRAMERAHESGASVSDAVAQLAADLLDDAQARVEERARTLEVKVAVPLGVCLLPAFVVLGIVPMVVGLVGSLSVR